jgi:hypothetical protein
MFKRVISAVIGTRHERERKKIQPIVDEINEHYARLQRVSEEELRGQTAKFRELIRTRTSALEARVAELKQAKHNAAPSARSSTPSSPGRMAAGARKPTFARRSPICSTRSCPRRSPPSARARGVSSGRR